MSSETDPTAFDPEQTSSFKVGTLSERLTLADEQGVPPHQVVPQAPEYLRYRGPALEYHHSDGNGTVTRIDHAAPGQSFATPEDRIRELMLARALLRHALHLVDKELNQVGPV